MESTQLDLKSLRNYGIHGALGLLMGIGAGYLLFYLLLIISSVLTTADSMASNKGLPYSSVIIGTTVLITILLIYGIYGFYIGYIFGGEKKSSRISITFALAGVFGGLVTAGLYAGGFITMKGDSGSYLVPLFITLVFTGHVLGFPKIKNMVLMTASSAFGAASGYGIFVLGQNITVYLNSIGSALFAFFIAIIFPLLAIGIAGASITIGMYFTEKTAYTSREIPGFLKIIRSVGVVLTLIVLFFSALMFVSVVKYATTDVSIDISSGDGNTTVLIPVLLENGNVMEMYGKPAISGSATTEIIDTDHGKAFKISGSGSTRITMNQNGGILSTDPDANEKFANGFTLSTSNATNYGGLSGRSVYAWVYSEEDGTMFSLSIIRDNGWGRKVIINTERVKLTRGWQEVSLSGGSMWYD